MPKTITFLLAVFLLVSCREKEEMVMWQNSYGPGTCNAIVSTPDSGIVACGTLSGNPFIVSLDKNYNRLGSFRAGFEGSITSVWANRQIIIAAGTEGFHPYLAVTNRDGSIIWDSVFTGYEEAGHLSLIMSGDDQFTAIGSPLPAESSNTETEIFIVTFNSSGSSVSAGKISFENFLAIHGAATDGSGFVYLASTRDSGGKKPKSTLIKASASFQVLWEKELYNNPVFGSYSLGIAESEGIVYVTGKTEFSGDGPATYNSFFSAVQTSGTVIWKKYLEYYNSGSSVTIGKDGNPAALNENCFVINSADISDNDSLTVYRLFSSCDPQSTDASGKAIAVDPSGNFIVGGTRGGSFYVAVKSLDDKASV